MATDPVALMWFRRDLRQADNPALLAALGSAEAVLPVFVLDDALWGPAGDVRRAFLAGCLRSLDESLDGHLVLRRGRPADVVAGLAREVEAARAFAAEDFGPYGRRRDDAVATALATDGRELVTGGSPYAVAPGSVRNRRGEPYKVFTPFALAWRQHGWSSPQRAPARPSWATGVATEPMPPAPDVAPELPAPGEAAARRAARRFWDADLDRYHRCRDLPGAEGTSRLSPYLRWGCLHPRQLLAELGRSPAHQAFRTELAWREFYADVLFHDPASSRRAWRADMRGMEVDTGPRTDAPFAAWAQGRTGYPLVDAGMRQLAAQGWVHNRVRMVVASFLVKDLHLDWRRGARYFLDHLVDGDLASNHHGWQWVAGTGTDASPYVRVFNPVTQSRRFDPDGTYIRRWVPELGTLGAATVHEPWKLEAGPPQGYPRPIVDHAAERAEALRRYEQRR